MAHWNQFILQDPSTSVIRILISFHDIILVIIVIIITTVSLIIIILIKNKYLYRIGKNAHKIEIIWTIIPGMILVILAIPSLRLLYIIDEVNNPSLTVKAIGHQWYWRYEYREFPKIKFDSYMLSESRLQIGDFRLLEVDNRLILPISCESRLLVTSSDVIHSWTIPSIGVKVDAIPGRLNQVSILPNHIGIYYGQCSEICGINHSFIPIGVEIVPVKDFIKWVIN